MANRLAECSSPYLQQHKDNPIDWYPWGDEVWDRARAEQKPVFLSVGYSSCHWCHVMAHESFEDPEVAEALNRDFVSIKLDREERPDVDDVYMTAVQMATGHGGWPMSVFLTPDKEPFFAGTYFPKDGRSGVPGFLTIVGSLAQAWRNQRDEVRKTAAEFASALAQSRERALFADESAFSVETVDQAVEALHESFDFEHGGFGDRPKFPPHSALRFLIDYAVLRGRLPGDGAGLVETARTMVALTLDQLVRGGIHDHVGGGFHRYATDDRWHLPHFEKMLYDNAQLLGALAHARREGFSDPSGLCRRAEEGIVDWLHREMTAPDGTLYSALDADTGGEEGATYLWSEEEVRAALGAGADAFLEAFQCAPEGNYLDEGSKVRTGLNVLHRRREDTGLFEGELALLRETRAGRAQPGLDDKALAAWNGLAIGALAEAGYVSEAIAAAQAWASYGSDLPHMVTRGRAEGDAFLDDFAFLADGFLAIAGGGGGSEWTEQAEALVDRMVELFGEPEGSFRFVRLGGEVLFGTSKPFMDNATPSPNGVAARALRRAGRVQAAAQVVVAGLGWVIRVPRATETLLREMVHLLVDSSVRTTVLVGSRTSVEVRLEPGEPVIDQTGWGYSELVLDVPSGLHINSDQPPATWLVPTVVRVSGVLGEAGFEEAPDGRYEGVVRIPLRLRPAGESRDFEVRVTFQACTERECFAPEERVLLGRLVGD